MDLFLIILIVIFIEAFTYGILKSTLMIPVVESIKSKNSILEQLFSCGYCLSFWITTITITLFQYTSSKPLIFFNYNLILATLFYIIVIHRMSTIWHMIIDKYFDRNYDKRYYGMFD